MFLSPIYPEIGHENSRFLSTIWTSEKGERNLYCRIILEPGMVLRSLFLHFQYCSTRSAGPLLILLNQIYIICFPGPVVLASPPLSSLQFKCLVRPTGPLFGHGLSILNPVQCHRGLALFKLFMSRGRDGDPFARMADVSIPPKWPSSKTMTVRADEKSTSLQEQNTLTHANYV